MRSLAGPNVVALHAGAEHGPGLATLESELRRHVRASPRRRPGAETGAGAAAAALGEEPAEVAACERR
jgi:hypothetical protein